MSHETIDYIERLHKYGFRVTPQRLIVLDAVCEIGGHATFGQIYANVKHADPSIDQSTIYRALDVLCTVGLVVTTDLGEEGKVYKIAGEARHHHLVCRFCGQVLSFEHQMAESLIEQIRTAYGFMVGADHLAFTGICRQCLEQERSSFIE